HLRIIIGQASISGVVVVYLLIIITFKVLGIVGCGFKSLLFSVKVYEPLPEIQLSKLIGAMQFCNHLET
ncbi:MAG TPA: hypothetical protein VFY68_03265, partial [Nitrososphaeraceae archaeon]|nr:hypothetical protein [Nitrososphaeraceae archaeon]